MTNNKIIDMHAHIFPATIAEKAVGSICNFYDIPMQGAGTGENLLLQAKQAGVEKVLIHSTATTSRQVKSINDFIINETNLHKEFIGFGTLHPDFEDIEQEVQRVIAAGLKGIKLHPDFQKFNIDDENACSIYKSCCGKLPILFHIGDYRQNYSSPRKLTRIMDKFPDLKIIAAHFGGWSVWEKEHETLSPSENLYFDTSSSMYDGGISIDLIYKNIKKHGVDKFFFGSDYPMWSLGGEIQKIKNLEFTQDEYEKIMYKNAEKFLRGQ